MARDCNQVINVSAWRNETRAKTNSHGCGMGFNLHKSEENPRTSLSTLSD